jgi:hypothetical protein
MLFGQLYGRSDSPPCRRRLTSILPAALALILLASPGFGAVRRAKAGSPGGIGFTSSTFEAPESIGTAPMTVQRLGGTDGAVTVDYAVTGGTATAGSDYQTVSGTLTWADGDGDDKPIQIPIIDDNVEESAETVVVTLSNPTGGAGLAGPSTATLTIDDNDALPNPGALTFTSANYRIRENRGTASLIVQRTGGTDGIVTVDYSVAGGTAQPGSDYDDVSGTLTWLNGDATTKVIQVPILDDAIGEGPETVIFALRDPSGGASLGTVSSTTLTIVDDDTLPGPGTFSFTSTVFRAPEGSGGVTVTVQRTDGGQGAVSVRMAAINGGATAGVDYKLPPMRVLRWADGDSAPKSLRVTFIDDSIPENTERFRLMLTAPTGGAAIQAPSTATVSILDDDE